MKAIDLHMTTPAPRQLTIQNKKGLHARAAAKFVGVAGSFEASIQVERNGQSVSGRSIMGLMMLAASPGTSILVSADGADATQALDAIQELIDNKFEED